MEVELPTHEHREDLVSNNEQNETKNEQIEHNGNLNLNLNLNEEKQNDETENDGENQRCVFFVVFKLYITLVF